VGDLAAHNGVLFLDEMRSSMSRARNASAAAREGRVTIARAARTVSRTLCPDGRDEPCPCGSSATNSAHAMLTNMRYRRRLSDHCAIA
jgi:predicted ATPase with chaperone activity